MVTDLKTDNPYASPNVQKIASGRSKFASWVFLILAFVFFTISLPLAWQTFELANQEYLHIWDSREALYDFELNGSPVSSAVVIRHGATIVLIQWGLAAALIIVPKLLTRNRATG